MPLFLFLPMTGCIFSPSSSPNDEKDSNSDDDDDDNEEDGGYYIMFRRPEELMPNSCVFDRLERGEADR